MTRRPWTDDEIGFLQDHEDWPTRRVAEELQRTASAIENARHKLRNGWTGNQAPAWTEDEDFVLISAPVSASAESLSDLLPGRGVPAIRKRRAQLGIKVIGHRPTEVAHRPLVAKTCLKCGRLLAGSWFLAIKRKGTISWSPNCRACASEAGTQRGRDNADGRRQSQARYEERLQSLTLERATRAGEPYTEADYEVLADRSLTDFQKALRLGRSWKATRSARSAAGLKSTPDGLGDPERDVWVIDNPNALEMAS